MKNALIVIDIQNDYCNGGPMAYNNSLEIIPKINRIRDNYDMVIHIRDYHPENHCSFKYYGGKYPKHCIQNTFGSQFNIDLIIKESDIIINRGTLQKYDSNSAFYDAEEINKETKLRKILKCNEILELYFCGNGIEECIYSTIIDAIGYRFKCYVINDAISSKDMDRSNYCINYLKSLRVEFI